MNVVFIAKYEKQNKVSTNGLFVMRYTYFLHNRNKEDITKKVHWEKETYIRHIWGPTWHLLAGLGCWNYCCCIQHTVLLYSPCYLMGSHVSHSCGTSLVALCSSDHHVQVLVYCSVSQISLHLLHMFVSILHT